MSWNHAFLGNPLGGGPYGENPSLATKDEQRRSRRAYIYDLAKRGSREADKAETLVMQWETRGVISLKESRELEKMLRSITGRREGSGIW